MNWFPDTWGFFLNQRKRVDIGFFPTNWADGNMLMIDAFDEIKS